MDTSNNNASAGAATGAQRSPGAARRRRKLRKVLAGAFALVVGLTGAGFLANALTPDPNTATAQQDETASYGGVRKFTKWHVLPATVPIFRARRAVVLR